jgi:hypothetical protein
MRAKTEALMSSLQQMGANMYQHTGETETGGYDEGNYDNGGQRNPNDEDVIEGEFS